MSRRVDVFCRNFTSVLPGGTVDHQLDCVLRCRAMNLKDKLDLKLKKKKNDLGSWVWFRFHFDLDVARIKTSTPAVATQHSARPPPCSPSP